LATAFGPRQPLEVFALGQDPLAPAWQGRLVWGLLILGLAARLLRYALQFPLWEDECFLSINLDRGWGGLMQPLWCHQTAPLLFLWAQYLLTRLLGFSELSLRLLPLLASLAGLLIFAHMARRLLKGTALVLAVGFLAVAYPGIRYAAEAKQYGTDLFVAAGLLALAVEWWRQPQKTRYLWILAALGPLAVGLSYPAVFVAGGIAAFIVLTLLTARQRVADGSAGQGRAWAAWAALVVGIGGGFGLFYFLSGAAQGRGELAYMQQFWHDAFPPSPAHPLELAKWLVVTHASELLAIPAGSERGGSSLTLVFCLAGLAVAIKRRSGVILALSLAPAGLQLAAAALHRYPYGGAVKFSMQLAPFICILAGLGAARLLALLASRPVHLRRGIAVVIILLSCVAVGSMLRDIIYPYKAVSDLRARSFAQWYWPTAEFSGEVVDAQTDLRLLAKLDSAAPAPPLSFGVTDICPDLCRDLNWGIQYLCDQRIYSPRHQKGLPPRYDLVSRDWPLRVVVYRVAKFPFDQQRLDAWLAEMQSRYELAGRETYPVPRYDKRERHVITVDEITIFTFVPKQGER
jgi:hypothetical protein